MNRMILTLLLGFSLLTTSALACEHSSQAGQSSHWSFSFFGWCHHYADQDHQRECDQNGKDSGQGRNCDRGKGNGGGYCSATGSTSSGGSSTTAGGGKGVSN
ncbi:MAG: hypothetical protein ABI072_08575 [Edaphobacter sp.]